MTSARDESSSQLLVPEAFVNLYSERGRLRPGMSRHELAERHEFCDDLSSLLADQAATLAWQQGLAPDVVLERIARGLREPQSPVQAVELGWVLGRIAERLDWPLDAAASAAREGPETTRRS